LPQFILHDAIGGLEISDNIGNNRNVIVDGLDKTVDRLIQPSQPSQDQRPAQALRGEHMVVGKRRSIPVDVGAYFGILAQPEVESKQQEPSSPIIT
jgi:hypothetical protein